MLKLGLTITDSQNCTVGTDNFKNIHTFDPTKKITKVECIINKDECYIIRINFYHHEKILVKVGTGSVIQFERDAGRVEVFEIADD